MGKCLGLLEARLLESRYTQGKGKNAQAARMALAPKPRVRSKSRTAFQGHICVCKRENAPWISTGAR